MFKKIIFYQSAFSLARLFHQNHIFVPSDIPRPSYSIGIPEVIPSITEIQTSLQISAVKAACLEVRFILDQLETLVQPGIICLDLDNWIRKHCFQQKLYPSPLGYHGFPNSVCISVNNVACHGVPNDYELQHGDIVSIDVSVFNGAAHGDACRTYLVGNVSASNALLVNTAKEARDSAIAACGPNIPFNLIGELCHSVAVKQGFCVLDAFQGHGIGSYFHGPPTVEHVPNFTNKEVMRPGMVFTIEPVVAQKINTELALMPDKWTIVADDDCNCAQFEHTILITEHGAEILT